MCKTSYSINSNEFNYLLCWGFLDINFTPCLQYISVRLPSWTGLSSINVGWICSSNSVYIYFYKWSSGNKHLHNKFRFNWSLQYNNYSDWSQNRSFRFIINFLGHNHMHKINKNAEQSYCCRIGLYNWSELTLNDNLDFTNIWGNSRWLWRWAFLLSTCFCKREQLPNLDNEESNFYYINWNSR